ncbi:MAG: crossover junction endodeoxyribonuclease RuvC [Rhodothermales bacterium]
MIVLGIDPGSRLTGFGVVEVDGPKETVIEYGVLRLDKHGSHQLRLKEVYDRISEVAARVHPDECAIEMPIYGRNPQSMLKLGRAQAAAMMAVLNRDVPVTEYAPKEVKKSVTGRGNASKEQVWYMVRAILQLDESKDAMMLDASDALAVGLCHAHRLTKSGSSKKHTGWESFLRSNPDRIAE